MHFCQDELVAILMVIPFIGIFYRKVSHWIHIKFFHNEKHHDKNCHILEEVNKGDDHVCR